MMQDTHDRLRIEAAQRDPAGFGELYEENFYRVYAYVVRRVGDRHQAEDLTADVFREALAGIGKFEWRGVPLPRGCFGLRRGRLRITSSVWAGKRGIRWQSRTGRLRQRSNGGPCCF